MKYNETYDGFELKYRWFSPIAIFLFFFCVIWDGFLIFWYSIGLNEDSLPWMFFLFPLIHVAAGIGLTYYTLCLFFNTTTISLSEHELSVKHSPIPWWKGNKNIQPKDVKQFYIKEKISKGKGGSTSTSYAIRCIFNNNKDTSIIKIPSMSIEDAQEIEKILEKHLGIIDTRVEGEYNEHTKMLREQVKKFTSPKPKRNKSKPIVSHKNISIADIKIKGFADYNDKTYELIHTIQYDWRNGDTDYFFHFLDFQKKGLYLYISRIKGRVGIFTNTQMSQAETLRFFPDVGVPSYSQFFEGKYYELFKHYKGNMFNSDDKTHPIKAEQWIYKADKLTRIRVVSNDGMIESFRESTIRENDFTKIVNP